MCEVLLPAGPCDERASTGPKGAPPAPVGNDHLRAVDDLLGLPRASRTWSNPLRWSAATLRAERSPATPRRPDWRRQVDLHAIGLVPLPNGAQPLLILCYGLGVRPDDQAQTAEYPTRLGRRRAYRRRNDDPRTRRPRVRRRKETWLWRVDAAPGGGSPSQRSSMRRSVATSWLADQKSDKQCSPARASQGDLAVSRPDPEGAPGLVFERGPTTRNHDRN